MNTTFQPYTKNIAKQFLAYISVLFLLFSFSCNDDANLIGADLIPDKDKIEFLDTTILFNGYLLDDEEYSSKNLTYFYIGELNDPYFGNTKASFASQYILTNTSVKFEGSTIDSVILYLKIDSIYGDFDRTKEIKVYKLSETLYSSYDSTYLSSTPVTDFFAPEDLISTQTIYSGDSLVKIKLKSSFADFLIVPIDSIYFYRTAEKFLERYLGVALVYDGTTELGGLLKINMTSSNSGIELYYKEPNTLGLKDTLEYSYQFSAGTKFNNILHDFSTGVINDFIENDSTESDSLLFIQGLGGMNSKIVFEGLQNFPKEYKYSILNANITIPVYQDANINTLTPPSNIFFIYAEDTNLFQVSDYSGDFFSGIYNETKQEYSFDISLHMKDILNGEIEDSSLNIRILNSRTFPNRAILKSGVNDIKLKVTYSKF